MNVINTSLSTNYLKLKISSSHFSEMMNYLYEGYQPSLPNFSNVNPVCMDDHTTKETIFSPPFSFREDLETILSYEYIDFPLIHVDEYQMNLDHEFDGMFNDDVNIMPMSSYDHHTDDVDHHHAMIGASEPPCMDITSMHHSPLVLPFQTMEVDDHVSLVHLLIAYAEAKDNQETELAEVIAQRVIQKVNPVGGPTDRVMYYMFRHLNKQDYLKEESCNNFYPAFKLFYQIFPYGKFAHFVANSAILEALPRDADVIHLIDFDIGEGLQWAPFMEAIKNQHEKIRLTSLKLSEEEDDDDDDENSPFRWRFEETKRRLCDHALSCGINMIVEEVGLQDLENLIKNITKEGYYYYERKSWYVFNCHTGLPHMGRVRYKKDVLEFVRVAQDFLHQPTCCEITNKGIITYGDGDLILDNYTTTSSYSSFLNANFAHYQALLESMEFNFPNHLGEARTALECLFVGPHISSIEWDRQWEERRLWGEVEFGLGLEGWGFSKTSLAEAKELVKDGVSPYGVRIEGEKKNEMVMEWNGTSMVRVCCWKN